MSPGKQGPLQDESAEWNRRVVGAEGRRISLRGIWWFVREADRARQNGTEGQGIREWLGRRLWAACGIREAPKPVARRHGLSAWNGWKRSGPLVIAHLPRRVVQFGNELRASDVIEMETDLETEMVDMGAPGVTWDEDVWLDAQARLRGADGEVIGGVEGLGVLGQFFWRARRALDGTPVVDYTRMNEEERGEWKGKTFICPVASKELFERLRPLIKRWRIQSVWAVDGSYKASHDPGVATMGRGAARHDGRTMSMAL